jgi:3-oxoacyl-(acyl-carrier-protein) synthase
MIAAIAGPDAPSVSGFIESAFSPLAYEAVRQCLTEAKAEADGSRTAIVLASVMGDSGTLDLGSRLLVAGEVSNPLLFIQSTANAILGRLSIDFAITGPLISLSAAGDLAAGLLATADLLLADGDVDRVVAVGVELSGTERTAAGHRELGTTAPAGDLAVAILLDRGDPVPTLPQPPQSPQPSQPPVPSTHGSLRGLIELAALIPGATS